MKIDAAEFLKTFPFFSVTISVTAAAILLLLLLLFFCYGYCFQAKMVYPMAANCYFLRLLLLFYCVQSNSCNVLLLLVICSHMELKFKQFLHIGIRKFIFGYISVVCKLSSHIVMLALFL